MNDARSENENGKAFAGAPPRADGAVAVAAAEDAGRADENIQTITQAVRDASTWVDPLRRELRRVIVGQDHLLDRLLVALLADGHVLLEGVPGLAKTLALRTLASAVSADFRRIQFTPDMLPADIVGTEVYNPKSVTFDVKQGPIFANLILADEINRAPAKVQSALLEAMQERQVTLGDETFPLPTPFLVMATQNPIEQEGTYALPEAQVDRFMLKVVVTFPTPAEERAIIDVAGGGGAPPEIRPVVSTDDVQDARSVVNAIYVDDKVKEYVVALVHATRDPNHYGLDLEPFIRFAASPRATLGLVAASRAHAFLRGRGYVTPQDVKAIAPEILRHRIGVSFEAEAEGLTSDDLVERILSTVPIP